MRAKTQVKTAKGVAVGAGRPRKRQAPLARLGSKPSSSADVPRAADGSLQEGCGTALPGVRAKLEEASLLGWWEVSRRNGTPDPLFGDQFPSTSRKTPRGKHARPEQEACWFTGLPWDKGVLWIPRSKAARRSPLGPGNMAGLTTELGLLHHFSSPRH